MKRQCVLAALAGLMCLSGLDRTPASPGQVGQEITTTTAPASFKSGTNLVQIAVVVRDAKGRAVGNLSAEDFQLADDRRPQLISRFSVERLQSREIKASRADNQAETGAVLANRFVAFVVDDEDLIPEHMPYATKAAIQHIDSLAPGDRAAVISTSGRTFLDFTGDHEKLRKAFAGIGSTDRRSTAPFVSDPTTNAGCMMTYFRADRIREGDHAFLVGCTGAVNGQPAPAEDLSQIILQGRTRSYAEGVAQAGDRDVLDYFGSLAKVIQQMSRMPGQRSILALSNGIYVPPKFRDLENQVIAAALQAHVVISGVDPRGVYIHDDPDDPTTWSDRAGIAETAERFGFMEDVTSATGGSYRRGNNDIVGALRALDATPDFVYLLGFAPANLKLDGRYHTVSVKLKHPQGLTLTARRGYYAANYAADPASQAKQQMEEAFFSDAEVHDLPVKLQTQYFRGDSGPTLTVIAQIDLAKIAFSKEGDRNHDHVSLVAGLFDQDGNYVAAFEKEIEMRLRDESLDTWRRSGLGVKTDFQVKPGRYLVRVVVRDGAGQAMAEQSTGVEIPW